jgi:hypothetical protein
MVVRLAPTGKVIQLGNGDIVGGGLGTIKGVAIDGVAGVLQDLTGAQQSQNWRRGAFEGSIQTVANATGAIDVTLNATTTIVVVQSIANVLLRSMGSNPVNPLDEGREVLIVHDRSVGSGFCTLPHNAGGIPVGFAPFFNSNLKPLVLGQTSAYLARAFFGRWRSDDSTAAPVPITIAVPALAAGVLGYVDTTLVGTPLEGTPANAVVTVQPQTDLAAAGVGNGYLVNARVSATNTLRCAFVGTLVGGNAVFTVGSA